MLQLLLALSIELFPVARYATAPRWRSLRDLVCRGKPGIDLKLYRDPAPDDSRKVLMKLSYQRAQRPGRDYENLQPGECTWNPYSLPSLPPEPLVVIIEVDREAQHWSTPGAQLDTTINAAVFFPDPITLPRYLSDPNHWWRFYVDDQTNVSISYGAFRSTVTAPTYTAVRGSTTSDAIAAVTPATPGANTRAGQSTSRSQPGAGSTFTPGGARVANIGSVGLIFRGVDRGWKQNTVRFSARANSGPSVSWSTEPPTKDATGALRFRVPNAWPVRATSTNGFASEYATVSSAVMPTGQKIYFVISVPADRNNLSAVYSGDFTTMAQTMVVRFTSLRVLNDSDKDSAGELSFAFYMTPTPGQMANCNRWPDCMNFFGPRSWETGTTHGLANTLKMENAPDKVRVWVHGWDSDTGSPEPWVREYGPMGTSWIGQPGSNSSADWNVTGREFDLSVLPTKTNYRIPFTLRSRDGFVFMFEVTGEVEVTRQ